MKNCPNPNCRQPVRSDWNCCVYCGTPLSHGSQSRPNNLLFIAIGAVLLIAVFLLLFFVLDLPARINGSQRANNPPDPSTQMVETGIPIFVTDDTTPSSENPPSGFEPTIIIVTATPESTPTKTITPTPGITCPDTFTPRVTIGDRAKVCTKSDRLIVRNEPDKDKRELARIYPGTIVKILEGPECADKSSWWRVEVSKGTEVYSAAIKENYRLDEDLFGWVREGGDTLDRFYLCKIED